jgi:hypothetical protein
MEIPTQHAFGKALVGIVIVVVGIVLPTVIACCSCIMMSGSKTRFDKLEKRIMALEGKSAAKKIK